MVNVKHRSGGSTQRGQRMFQPFCHTCSSCSYCATNVRGSLIAVCHRYVENIIISRRVAKAAVFGTHFFNKEIVDSTLGPRCATHARCVLADLFHGAKYGCIRCSRLGSYTLSLFRNTHDAPYGQLREKVTSSTKPKYIGLTYRNAVKGGPCHGHSQQARESR